MREIFDAGKVVSTITRWHILVVIVDTFKCLIATIVIMMAMVAMPKPTDFAAGEYATYLELRDILQLQYPHMTDELFEIIYTEARESGLRPRLIAAVINEESRWIQRACSPSGAIGYMQVMPFHYRQAPARLYSARMNIHFGSSILRDYLKLARGNLVRALKNYNSGPASSFFNGEYIARIVGNLDMTHYIASR